MLQQSRPLWLKAPRLVHQRCVACFGSDGGGRRSIPGILQAGASSAKASSSAAAATKPSAAGAKKSATTVTKKVGHGCSKPCCSLEGQPFPNA